MRQRVQRAIQHVETRTNLSFVEASSGARLQFGNSEGCSSYVGRKSRFFAQRVNLNFLCQFGSVVHEIGHAVGLWHEQSRNDRDDYVRIFLDNVIEVPKSNFNTYGFNGREVGPYDFSSVMHYDCWGGSGDGSRTLEPIVDGVTCADVGLRDGLSPGDVAAINELYPLDNQSPTADFAVGCSGLVCGLIDQSSDPDGTIVSWAWDFGDGNGSSQSDPNHTYSSGGTYTITLTVTDDAGATNSTSESVTVS